MLLDIKNEQGYIIAYISFYVVDKETRLDDKGKSLFINGFWIHPSLRRSKFRTILRMFIDDIIVHPTTQNIEYVYWERNSGKICRYLASRFIKYRLTKHGE